MSSTINASTASGGGIITSADASGILQLQTAGTPAVTINASQNVGIGTSSPSSPLQVVSAANALAITINGRSSDNLGAVVFYANNGSTQHATVTASASEFRLSSVPVAAVQTFYTNAAERMRIDSTGQQSSTIVGYGTYNEYKCRAWVNFNGTGVVAIRASGNVSSITDNGVGDYTVNFTTAMSDANYAPVTMAVMDGTQFSGAGYYSTYITYKANTRLVGSVGFLTGYSNQATTSSKVDCADIAVAVFR